jgi:hypothetical protein
MGLNFEKDVKQWTTDLALSDNRLYSPITVVLERENGGWSVGSRHHFWRHPETHWIGQTAIRIGEHPELPGFLMPKLGYWLDFWSRDEWDPQQSVFFSQDGWLRPWLLLLRYANRWGGRSKMTSPWACGFVGLRFRSPKMETRHSRPVLEERVILVTAIGH